MAPGRSRFVKYNSVQPSFIPPSNASSSNPLKSNSTLASQRTTTTLPTLNSSQHTFQIESLDSLNQERNTGSIFTKKGRGPTRGKGLASLNKTIGKKLPIEISLDLGRPVDRIQSAKLSSELGLISREFMRVPTCWRELEKSDKQKAYARLDEQNELNGQECDRIDFFKRTHCSNGKGWTTIEAEMKHNEMQALLEESTSMNSSLTADDICDKVLGVRSGYIKGLGYGPKTKRIYTSNSKIQELEDSLKASQTKCMELSDCYVDLKAQVAQQAKWIESLVSAGFCPPVPKL